ncbi:TMEM175 family protein [Humibacter albus]|uniref:TMEM175 family protein n=1 Tax=Humibacter albus TaxID=427754 RepID=UPI0003B69F0B|nr:TMEM175 family protein [Humibacter albus]
MAKRAPSTTSRLSAYTDAVFAVIITIMALEIRPPDSPTLAGLFSLWPTVVSYAVSYVFVAIIWMNHHYLMGYSSAPTVRLIWLNFGHLFFVSLLPFATSWMADTELAHLPVITYAILFVVTDGMYNLFEREILRHSDAFTPREYVTIRRRSLAALALFTLAAIAAFFEPWVGFGIVCVALALHLRPDVPRWLIRARRGHGAGGDDPSGAE